MQLDFKRSNDCNGNCTREKVFTRLQSLLTRSAIGLDKLTVRAKGINHPKHAVKPACACLMRESASPVSHFTCEGREIRVTV